MESPRGDVPVVVVDYRNLGEGNESVLKCQSVELGISWRLAGRRLLLCHLLLLSDWDIFFFKRGLLNQLLAKVLGLCVWTHIRIFKLNVFGNGLVLVWAGYYWDCYQFDFDIAHTMIGSMKCPCRGLMPVLALNPDWSILNHSCVTRTSHVWRIVGYRIDISVLLVCDELISQLNTRQLGRDIRTKHFSAHWDTVRWISHWWIMTLLVQQYPAGVW